MARLLPLALRGLERVVPENALALRLAALGLARRPGYAAVAVAFVVVSVGFALFASSYRSTLVVAQQQEAAFAVPADEVVSEDLAQLIPVRSVVTPPVERSLDARVSRVTRVAGSIAGADVTGITVLGLPRATLAGIGGWRSDFASAGPSELARDVDPRPAGRAARPADPGRRAAAVAADGRQAERSSGSSPTWRRRTARSSRFAWPATRGRARPCSSRRCRQRARGGRLVAFRLEPPPKLEERGADSGAPAVGSVELGPPRVDGRPLTDYGDWLGTVGVDRLKRRGALRFHVTLTNEVDTYLRPRQPTDGLQIPAVVSPFLATLAGPDRVLGVTVNGEQLQFRVAAVARRFPGISQSETSDFLVVDRPALDSALNTSTPGSGFATELWLDTDPSRREAVEARLRKPPFTALAVSSRSQLEHSLRAEPIARAALAMLETAALTAIVLALLGLVLGTLSERRDEAAELFDLEAQGVAPASLRRQLRLRASLAGLAGAIGGVATGVVLSLLVVRFVELTANATSPEPPLELVARLAAARARRRTRGARGDRARRRRDLARLPRPRARSLRGTPRDPRGRGPGPLPRPLDAGGRRRRAAGADAERRRGRDPDRARAERRGQDLVPAHPGRARPALGRDDPRLRPEPALARARRPRALPLRGRRLPRPALRAGAGARADRARAGRAAPARRGPRVGAARRGAAATASASARSSTPGPRSSPAASSSGSRSAPRSRTGRGCCSPTSRPASSTRRAPALVYDAIAELAAAEGCTVVIVSHDPASTAIADRFVHIRDGRVSEETVAGEGTIVVGRGGWLRLPQEFLERAGIGTRAAASLEDGRIVVSAAGGDGVRPEPELAPLEPVPAGAPVARAARGREDARSRRGRRPRLRRPRRRVPGRAPDRRHRAFGLGQDDAAAPARRARSAGRGRGARRRHGRERARPAARAPSCAGARSRSCRSRAASSRS